MHHHHSSLQRSTPTFLDFWRSTQTRKRNYTMHWLRNFPQSGVCQWILQLVTWLCAGLTTPWGDTLHLLTHFFKVILLLICWSCCVTWVLRKCWCGLLCQVLHIHSSNCGTVFTVGGHSDTNIRNIASVVQSGALIIDSEGSNRVVAYHVLWTLSKHEIWFLLYRNMSQEYTDFIYLKNVKEQSETFAFNIHIYIRYEG